MKYIHLDQIQIGERIRRQHHEEHISELADSIVTCGLLHPIVLRNGTTLVVGESRTKALRHIYTKEDAPRITFGGAPVPHGFIPYVDVGELSEDEALEAELHENIKRADISWQERTAAVAKLHALRQRQEPGHTLAATAREVQPGAKNPQTENMRRTLLVAEFLSDPEVANAASEKAALRIASAKLERDFTSVLAARISSDDRYTIIEGDAIDALGDMRARFDIILTDPPYGQSAHKIDAEVSVRHTYNDDWSTVRPLLERFSHAAFRAAQDKAHLYMFCNIRRFLELADLFTVAGWRVWSTPLIWVKNGGHGPDLDFGPTRRYECILYAIKGERRLIQIARPDVLVHPIETKVEFAAAKPPSLFEDLLRRSVLEGVSEVCDPFCGSGPIFPAAHACNVRAVGIDKDPEALKFARQRLMEMQDEGSLQAG